MDDTFDISANINQAEDSRHSLWLSHFFKESIASMEFRGHVFGGKIYIWQREEEDEEKEEISIIWRKMRDRLDTEVMKDCGKESWREKSFIYSQD